MIVQLNHLIFYRCRLSLRTAAGLSYTEVMVSMLTSALFLSTTLQAYIAATSIRARTQQVNTAIASAQADAEAIRQMAQASPKSAAECQLPSSGSYAQQIMMDVIAKDTAALNLAPQNQPPEAVIGSLQQDEGQAVIKQQTTFLIAGLPSDYKLQRILSVDKSKLPSVQVLQVSYQVLRTQSQMEDNADYPQSDSVQAETSIAQQHTSVLPNAALVCFL